MAVRVISEKPVKTRKTVCGNCGHELEFTNADVKTDYDTDYTGSRDSFRYIECPSPACAAQGYRHRIRGY